MFRSIEWLRSRISSCISMPSMRGISLKRGQIPCAPPRSTASWFKTFSCFDSGAAIYLTTTQRRGRGNAGQKQYEQDSCFWPPMPSWFLLLLTSCFQYHNHTVRQISRRSSYSPQSILRQKHIVHWYCSHFNAARFSSQAPGKCLQLPHQG